MHDTSLSDAYGKGLEISHQLSIGACRCRRALLPSQSPSFSLDTCHTALWCLPTSVVTCIVNLRPQRAHSLHLFFALDGSL